MKLSLKPILIFLTFSFFASYSFAQITPGLIVEPATGAGRIVLDPNLDGYTSLTTAGFSGLDDQTSAKSEIVFKKMTLISEPPNDLSAGPSCNYTDFVRDTINANMNSAGGFYLDANNNWIFRLRLGTYSPNSKSYSILIDTDGKFGNTGANADAQYSTDNPGFEIEILLSTKNGVYVYDVDSSGVPLSSVLKRSYTVTTNYQKSKSLSAICGSNDFFLDLFVPFGDLTTDFGITTSTPLRWAITDNMSSNQSTLGHLPNISDIWGINGANSEAGLKTFIDNQTPTCASCNPSGLRSACPFITTPIANGAAIVKGTSTEANGTTITLYKNGAVTAFTTTVSAGAWTISGISPTLATSDVIGATATASGKGESIFNCNTVTVTGCGVLDTLNTANIVISTKTVCGNSVSNTALPGASIQVYLNGVLQSVGAGNNTVDVNGKFIWDCNNANPTTCTGSPGCLANNSLFDVLQTKGGCTSESVCLSTGGAVVRSDKPTITTAPIINTTTTVTGACTSGATVVFYVNGVVKGTVTNPTATTWSASSLTLASGDVLTAKAKVTGKCQSPPSTSSTVSRVSNAPEITGTACGSSTITGTSSEASGTRIKLYKNGTLMNAGAADSTTVSSTGAWTTTVVTSLVAGDVITAKARTTTGSLSSASNSITYTTKSTNAVTISGSYTNQSTSVTGTGTTGDVIRLYIDPFTAFPNSSTDVVFATTTVSGGAWTIAVTAGTDLFKNAELRATASTGANCESDASSAVTVTSVAPTALNVSQTVTTCNGIANVSIPTTQNGILYQLYDGATPFSNGVVGNGGTITLLSSQVTLATSPKTGLTVKATSIIDETSTATMTGTVTISLTAADSTWTGGFSTDWFDYRNWCLNGAIPTSTIKAKILAATPFAPIIAASGAVCNELILYSGSTLSSSTNQNLDVYGAWINNGGTYTANTGSVTFRGTDTLSIRGTTATTFGNVTMNLTGTTGNDIVTLAKPATVTGVLTFTDGIITTSSTNILSLTSTASSPGGSVANTSFVNGPMNKAGTTAFTFPVGSGTTYGPIGLGTPSASSTFQAQYFNTAYSNTSTMAGTPTPVLSSVSLVEYWNLSETVGSATAPVQLFWQNSTTSGLNNTNCANLQEARWNGTAWENVDVTNNETISGCPGTIATSGSITTSTSVAASSFGIFTFGSTSVAALPVKLISFTGKCINQDVGLKWTTASEINNDYFTIERGINKINVTPIVTIKGNGNSSQLINYEFIDNGVISNNLPDAVFYYRLKQTDFNGEFEYSDIVAVKNCRDNLSEIVVYPNVSNGKVQLINHNEIVTNLEVYNSLGALVFSSEILNPKAEIFLNLTEGMYYYFLKNEYELVGKGKLMIK